MSDKSGAEGFRMGRLVAVGVFAVLVGLLAFAGTTIWRQGEKLRLVQADADAALAAVIPPSTLSAAATSVYMPLQNGRRAGTAFVIDRDGGVLATAAHVVDNWNVETDKLEIVNRSAGTPIRIKGFRKHAGYGAFRRMVNDYSPINPQSRAAYPRPVDIVDLPLDAALIFVDPIDPETGENVLGPSLPIASREKLLALKTGDVVALLGYPDDMMNIESVVMTTEPRAERGVVAAMISSLDLAGETDPETVNLIVHRIQLIGGHSGSPLLNGAGEVVGINTHSEGDAQTRAGGGDAVAQRADVLHDMLTPLGEERRLADVYALDWKRRLARWPAAMKALPAAFYAAYSGSADMSERRAGTVEELISANDGAFTANVDWAEFGPPVAKFVHAPTDLNIEPEEEDAEEEDEDAEDDQEAPVEFEAAAQNVFVIDEVSQFALQRRFLASTQNHVVFAVDYVTSDSLTYCPLALYSRKLESTTLERVSVSMLPFKRIADGGAYEFIIQRSLFCRDADNRLLFGVVSWDKPEGETGDEVAMSSQAPPGLVSVAKAMSGVLNTFNCSSPVFADRSACVLTIEATAAPTQ